MAGERVQRRRVALSDLPFASPQDDGIVLERWRCRCKGVRIGALQPAQVSTGCVESELTTTSQRRSGSGRIEPAQILTRLREGDMHEAGFIARPSRSLIAEAHLQICK